MAGENLSIGQDFGGYAIAGVAGSGGMGVVYRAVQRALSRTVALKVIRAEIAQSPEYRWRFLREAELASAVNHPNIVPVYDAGDHGGLLYMAMQWVDGVDLRTLIGRESRLDPNRAVRIGVQLAGALQALATAGLVHRDIKPSNVLVRDLGGQDHVYLTDFGIAKVPGADDNLTRTGWLVGTPGYMSPEQFRGEPADARSDLYALGCVAFEALTGKAPFSGHNDHAVAWAHASGARPVASAMRPELGDRYDAFFARALAIAPEDRFPSGDAFAGALQSADAGPPRTATQPWPSAGTPAQPWPQTETIAKVPAQDTQTANWIGAGEGVRTGSGRPERSRRLSPLVATSAAVIAIAGIAAVIFVTRPHAGTSTGSRTTGSPTSTSTTTGSPTSTSKGRPASPSAGTPINVGTNSAAIAITHSGQMAYATSFYSNEVIPINLATGAAGTPMTVGNDPFGIAITPDDQTAYVACLGSNAVYPVDLTTGTVGTPIPVYPGPYAIAITKNGRTAYVADSNSSRVSVIDVTSNTVTATITVGNSPQSIAIAPNQQTVYVGNYEDGTVTPIAVATNIAGQPITVGYGLAAIAIAPNGVTAYVANSTVNTVTPIDLATNIAGAAIHVGEKPWAIAITPSGSTAYVADRDANTVTPINLATGQPGPAIPVGSAPHGIAINGDTAYVADGTDHNVTPIRNVGG
jgi:serine/threonine-protein kinase